MQSKKKSKKKGKTSITIRQTSHDKKDIAKVMNLWDEKTQSKAYLKLPEEYLNAIKKIDVHIAGSNELQSKLDDLEVLKYDLKSCLDRIMKEKAHD